MDLYGHGSSGNVYKPQLLMGFLGVEYTHHPLNFWEDTRTPEFRAMNPNGKVPCLKDGDTVVWESNAILQYLANGTSWWPTDRLEQARVLQWMFFEQYSHEPFVATSRAILHFDAPSPERDAALAAKRDGGEHALKVMDSHLAHNDWFIGGPSIADIALYAYTHVADEGGFALENYPSIQAWCKRLEALSGYRPIDSFQTLVRA